MVDGLGTGTMRASAALDLLNMAILL